MFKIKLCNFYDIKKNGMQKLIKGAERFDLLAFISYKTYNSTILLVLGTLFIRFNLLGLINQQCTAHMSVAGLEHMTTGSVAKRLTLSHHTSRQNLYSVFCLPWIPGVHLESSARLHLEFPWSSPGYLYELHSLQFTLLISLHYWSSLDALRLFSPDLQM